MSYVTAPLLFLPPEPPVELRGTGPFVMGRSRSCDLRLPSGDASRRHAEIVPDEGGFLLRDLASTNGTFVNGERVSEHRLRPGDRIQIGSSLITFCQVEARPERGAEPVEAQTVLTERPAWSDVFQGDLSEIPPFAVLQILEMGRKTGLLAIDSDRETGRLWLEGGAPVHAETKHQVGFDAALALVHAALGRFTFDPQAEIPQRTIKASVTELLLEASRLMDEGRTPIE
jgi:pSer/pThr/pTyr-binding forkhead associated (FHA) protein